MERSTYPVTLGAGATSTVEQALAQQTQVYELAEKIRRGQEAFKRIADAANAGEDVATKVNAVLDDVASRKRESVRRPGQPRRGSNFTAPSSARKKAKRRAQGQARRK